MQHQSAVGLIFVIGVLALHCEVSLGMKGRILGRSIGKNAPLTAVSEDFASSEYGECFDNFEVNENTIIRTQDSRTLGARYLNETEFSGKKECMQWCCHTNECNVAVYEDKNKGSCYIFDCGPHNDFKCKFTSHSHYTSAILKVNRHSYDLGKWGFDAKHEEELNQLREKTIKNLETLSSTTTSTSVSPPESSFFPSTSNYVTSTPGLHLKFTTATAANPFEAKTERRCSRYQFECRNTSECIAIYNACDGIPQCGDGSDESEELGCPTGNKKKGSNDDDNYMQNNDRQWKSAVEQKQNHAGKQFETGSWNRQQDSQRKLAPMQFDYPHQQAADYQQQEQRQQLLDSQRLQHNQPSIRQQHYRARPKQDLQTSVFNHKANGLIQDNENFEYQDNPNYHRPSSIQNSYGGPYEDRNKDSFRDSSFSQIQQQPPSPPRPPSNYHSQDYDGNSDYWPPEKEKSLSPLPSFEKPRITGKNRKGPVDSNVPRMFPQNQEPNHGMPSNVDSSLDLQENYDDANMYPARNNYPVPSNLPQKNLPLSKHKAATYSTYFVQTGKPKADFQTGKKFDNNMETDDVRNPSSVQTEMEAAVDVPESSFKDSQNDRNSLKHKSHKTSEEIENVPAAHTENKKQKSKIHAVHEITSAPVKHLSGNIHSHSQLNQVEVNLAEVEVQKVEHTSESNGAVLALTLGLSITGILLVLVGCRIRMVRRHLRRGRSPYAHDADYLVNGMYL